MSLTFVDIFCGAGGSSTGLVAAGYELKLAANHWARAIETHAANHRDAEHLCADINNYDMRRLPRADVLWASPICTEISPAGGRKRTRVCKHFFWDQSSEFCWLQAMRFGAREGRGCAPCFRLFWLHPVRVFLLALRLLWGGSVWADPVGRRAPDRYDGSADLDRARSGTGGFSAPLWTTRTDVGPAGAETTGEPMHTLSTKDSAGLLRPAPNVEDCYFRMVQPREQLYAQRFPKDYIVHGNKGEQTMQAGNAVSCNVAQWVGQRVKAVL